MSDFLDILNQRTAAEHFDPAFLISDSEITELIAEACQAPSTFNIQHWRFIAVKDAAVKRQLKSVTIESNQDRVVNASIDVVILGDLEGHVQLQKILDQSVRAGLLKQDIADMWIAMANKTYGTDPRMAREEAVRSGSLAAMTLMLAAGNRGYVSCPIGFNPMLLKEILKISDRYVPVMMLSIGRPTEKRTQRRPRLEVEQILAFDSARKLE